MNREWVAAYTRLMPLLEDDERERAICAFREQNGSPAAANTVRSEIVTPLEAWIEREYQRAGHHEGLEAAFTFLNTAHDICAAFEQGVVLVEERLDTLERHWRDWTATMGQAALLANDQARRQSIAHKVSGGRARTGSVKPITATIRAMLEEMDDQRADAVMAEMAEDAAGRENVLTGIREYRETVFFTAVTAERIEYVDPNGKPGSITRKSLGNAISKVRS